jgi:hypothetical protein
MKKLLIAIILLMPFNVFAYSDYIIPGGETIGISVNNDGVVVMGFYKVNNDYINSFLEVGDNIIYVNDEEVDNIEELSDLIEKNINDNSVSIIYVRDGVEHEGLLELRLVDGIYKSGLYIKSNVVGIGTVTYVDGQIYGAPLANTAGQNLKEIIDCLLLPGAKIEIKVPGHRYEYDGRLEIRTIAFAIDQLMPYIEKESNLANLVNEFRNEEGGNCIKVVGINSYDICGYVKEDKYRKNMIYRQYLFHKYMSMFLEGYQKSTKQVVRINGKQVGISYDKMLLISRALYIVGYTKNDDRSYYEEWNDDGEKKNDKLKNALRRYKEVTIRTDNAYYNH